MVAIGDDLESSILSTLSLKNIGVAKVWAKAQSSSHHRILAKLGADRIIHPEDEMGQRVANVMISLMFIGGGSTSTAGGVKVTTFMVSLLATPHADVIVILRREFIWVDRTVGTTGVRLPSQVIAMTCSRSVYAARCARSISSSRSLRRRILPTLDLGSSLRNSISRGIL